MAAIARHIRRNDSVLVIAGKDKGKRGRVLRMDAKKNGAYVEGVNMIKRHTKPNPQKQVKGGIVEKEAAVAVSNLMVLCKECDKPSRVGYAIKRTGVKTANEVDVRISALACWRAVRRGRVCRVGSGR